MRIRAWTLYLVAALVAVAGYFLTPADTWTQTIYAELVGLCATGAIVVGVVRHRPGARAAWLWFAAGQLLNVLGTLAEAVIGRVWHQETWPSLADVLWLGLYPGLAIGLLLVLAMVARLLVGNGSRSLAFRLLAGALVLYLVGDATWAVLNYLGVEPGPAAVKLLQMNFLTAYVLVGAAGLHRSAREVGEPATRPAGAAHPRLAAGAGDPRLPGVAQGDHRRGRHRDRLDGLVPVGGDAHGAARAADRAPGQAAQSAHPRRRAHRAAQPPGVVGGAARGDGACPQGPGRPLHRHAGPRPLQELQRRVRAPGRRPSAQERGRRLAHAAPRGRPARPLRRRGVHRHAARGER